MKYIPYILLVIAVGIIAYLIESKPVTPDPVLITEWHTDTLYVYDTAYVPEYIDRVVTKYDTVIDTAYVIKDYSTKYYYSDTLMNDTNAIVIVNDTVYRNRILSRSKRINIFTHTKYETTYISVPEQPKWHIYAGAGVSGNPNTFGFDINAGFMSRKGTVYTVGYDVVNMNYRVGVLFRIK